MIKVYKDSKVYVHCPAGAVTGGAELLHQLVHYLRNNEVDAYIVYYGGKAHQLPNDYKVYNIALTEEIEDKSENIEVFIESQFDWIKRYANTQKFLWWISVDNFFLCSTHYLEIKDLASYSIKLAIKSFVYRCGYLLLRHDNRFKKSISVKYLSRLDVTSGYQSEYAQNYLQNKGFGEIVPLKDYINTDYLANYSDKDKEDIVLYNPRKGLQFTKKLIAESQDLKWIPIQNMTREQVVKMIRRAKVYVDFGYHPGKDRLPRECAASGCCVITGKRGSAGFFEDVAVPNKYKFDERHTSIDKIIETIRDTIRNYSSCINDFTYYRDSISQEKEEFENQIRKIFLINRGG